MFKIIKPKILKKKTIVVVKMYKLVAIDLDGTLLDDNKRIPQKNKDTIKAIISKGIIVTLATGRMFSAAIPFAKELGLKAPIIVDEGSVIRDTVTKETIFNRKIPIDVSKQIIRYSNRKGIHLNVFIDDNLFVNCDCMWLKRYMEENKFYYNYVEISNLEDLLSEPPNKLLMVADEKSLDEAQAFFSQNRADDLTVVRSSPIFLAFTAPFTSKGSALHFFAHYYNIAMDEVIAIGDGDNDISMIKKAGLGIAMSNGTQNAKLTADYITESNTDDGVAKALEKFIL